MIIGQGETSWADLGEPVGSAPGYRCSMVVVQRDVLKTSRIVTVVCVPMTSNLKWRRAPENVLLSGAATSLPQASVAYVSLIVALDKRQLVERGWESTNASIGTLVIGN